MLSYDKETSLMSPVRVRHEEILRRRNEGMQRKSVFSMALFLVELQGSEHAVSQTRHDIKYHTITVSRTGMAMIFVVARYYRFINGVTKTTQLLLL